jgi:hypothetical protein
MKIYAEGNDYSTFMTVTVTSEVFGDDMTDTNCATFHPKGCMAQDQAVQSLN